jgi:putative heme iron utilization protein
MEAADVAALKALLSNQPIAALATLHNGEPAVSMVPFAMLRPGIGFVIHVSRLATHTKDMLDNPAVSLLVTAPVSEAVSPLSLPRASIRGKARKCTPESVEYREARGAYLAKLPDAEELFSFPDFALFIVEPKSIRYVAGFGRAMSLTAASLPSVMGAASS